MVARARKVAFRAKLQGLLDEYKNILVLRIDNVGSRQMQLVRLALRGRAVMLMGKNTIIRKLIAENVEKNPKLEVLLPIIKGNVGFCFTNEGLKDIRKVIQENKVPAAAKTGAIAPCDVIVPAGPTPLDPGQTSFFQALNISTKITRGAIEILNPVQLITAGDKVSSSAVALLTKLGIQPFEYGIMVEYVYEDGNFYDASVLDMTEDILARKFARAANVIAAISLAARYPTLASLPHSMARGFRVLVALAIETDYTFEEAKEIKEIIANPEAYAAAQAAAGGGGGGGEEAKEEAAVEEEEEEEEEPAAGLFGDDEEDY